MGKDDLSRNMYMLKNGSLGRQGYDWWWHSFTGRNAKTGEEKAFFIEYFIINPELGGEEPVLGCGGKNKPSYVMVKAGHWGEGARQFHRFFGIDEMDMAEDELRLVVGDCILSEDLLRGNVEISPEECEAHPEWMCDSGRMSWLLRPEKELPFNVGYGASEPMRKMNIFEMFWHVQGMKTAYQGTVYLDGVEYKVTPETSYGYQDKNWGKDFTSPWVWLSSCDLRSLLTDKKLENSAFDIGGGRPKAGPVALDRKLLMCFWYEGKRLEFNFSKLWTNTHTKFKCSETRDKIIWRIKTQSTDGAMELAAWCLKKDMLLINYEAPDGVQRHNRLWNGGNGHAEISLYQRIGGTNVLLDRIAADHMGCEYGEYCEPEQKK